MVAALRGGAGKTTVALGLIQALRARGMRVAAYKKGPDYIDPFWHTEAAGVVCRNLDPFLMGWDQLLRSFLTSARDYDCAVVEANRGLFDGMDAAGSYSSAELARRLNTPVLLVLECTMASRTVAAVALGCKVFDQGLTIAGVILNSVGTARQERLIRQAVETEAGLKVFGAIPRLKLNMPQRHMGLLPPQEHKRVGEVLEQIATTVANYIDLDGVVELMAAAAPLEDPGPPEGLGSGKPKGVRVGVIRDGAFGFYYQENLEALVGHGAEVVFCSALEDKALEDVQALYIGGGFPETHAEALADNASFRASLKAAASDGLPIYAECGGFMYLGESLIVQGRRYPMAGILPVEFEMFPRPQGHGYSILEVVAPNPFLPVGTRLKAHEFHYSRPRVLDDSVQLVCKVLRGKGIRGDMGGMLRYNCLGTYHHLHALGAPCWAPGMVQAALDRGLE